MGRATEVSLCISVGVVAATYVFVAGFENIIMTFTARSLSADGIRDDLNLGNAIVRCYSMLAGSNASLDAPSLSRHSADAMLATRDSSQKQNPIVKANTKLAGKQGENEKEKAHQGLHTFEYSPSNICATFIGEDQDRRSCQLHPH